jgi:hypothetical protein
LVVVQNGNFDALRMGESVVVVCAVLGVFGVLKNSGIFHGIWLGDMRANDANIRAYA